MTSAFSQRLCRKVRQEGYGANRRFRWVPGADYSTQVEVLFRREHAHRVWNAIQALAMAWYLGAIWFREAEEERRFAREFEGWEP